MLALGLWLTMQAASDVPATSRADPRQLIEAPSWMHYPEAGAHYSQRAAKLALDGSAVIECSVHDVGKLHDCRLLKEEPQGAGFGETALDMSKYYRLNPKDQMGIPVDGRSIRVSINFRLRPVYLPKVKAAGPATGTAAIDCRVSTDGRLDNCYVEDQKPANNDLGDAALSFASQINAGPRREPGRVNLLIEFTKDAR